MRGHRIIRRSAGEAAAGWLRGEPLLEELLSDPVLGTLMRSDGVDPHRFRAFLQGLRKPPRHHDATRALGLD
jgi:hypothetical protein